MLLHCSFTVVVLFVCTYLSVCVELHFITIIKFSEYPSVKERVTLCSGLYGNSNRSERGLFRLEN
jgi:hypothetical protein